MIQSVEEFLRLRKSDSQNEYLRAANEEAPVEVWRNVLNKYPDMRQWVAYNKTIPEEIIRLLADDDDHKIRAIIARKRKAPLDILEKLALDSHESVRLAVATNKKIPKEILEKMKNDDWDTIVETVKERLDY